MSNNHFLFSHPTLNMYLIIFGLLKGTKIAINNLEPKNNHKHHGLKKNWLRTIMPLDGSQSFKIQESDALKLRGHPTRSKCFYGGLGWKFSAHIVKHNPFKERKRIELEPGGHPHDHNIYTNSNKLDWKSNAHQADHKPF